jgi:hypothetical protein
VEQPLLKQTELCANCHQVHHYETHPPRINLPDSLVEIKVRVHNKRAGHHMPTSLTNIRQIWLEMTVKDQSGKVLMTTGTVGKDGSLPEYPGLSGRNLPP